jgi:hypothetical protein
MLLAIDRDEFHLPNGRVESYADRWVELARSWGHEVRLVDAMANDIIQQVRGADGFLWRFNHEVEESRVARRLIPALQRMLYGCVYPDVNTCWHFDDKLAQKLAFEALDIPTPRTWLFWRYDDAVEFCRSAAYPIVCKLAGGASAENVWLIRSADEALRLVHRLFRSGIVQPSHAAPSARWPVGPSMRAGLKLMLTRQPPAPAKGPLVATELHNNYFYAQEFLAANAFDTRITVIGNRAWGFRRFNRPGDFRASGSGRIDTDPAAVDERFIRLALRVAKQLGTQSLAVDGLMRGDQPVISEVSYGFVSWVVHACPGHWELRGDDAQRGELAWVPGPMWPEEAILRDLLERIGGAR